MKKWKLALCISALLNSPLILADTQSPKATKFWNPVSVYNHTPYTIYYNFSRSYLDSVNGTGYKLEPNTYDTYHSGTRDDYTYLIVSACTQRDAKGYCLSDITHTLPNPYNVEKISTINIKAVDKIEITCLDGGTTSCVWQ